MALIKSKELENGVTLEYWVVEPKINMVTKQTEVLMLGYKNKEARIQGKQFIVRERVPSINGIYLTGEQVYTALKTSRKETLLETEEQVETNWFADAVDD